MGGKIWVESDPGNGAKFAFTFQAKRGSSQESDPASDEAFLRNTSILTTDDSDRNADESVSAVSSYKGRCILLAEDIEINREILMTLLEPTALKIVCAENGLVAVSEFSSAPEKYDMIFMDLQMPEMDGFEATRRIRSLDVPAAKTIPIIAMTANVFREDIEKCLNVGMNEHISKPLDIDRVFDIIRKYLHKKA